jgi:hypothetical protein
VEGDHDLNAIPHLCACLGVETADAAIVDVKGRDQLRKTRQFFRSLGFSRVAVVADLDFIFSHDLSNWLKLMTDELEEANSVDVAAQIQEMRMKLNLPDGGKQLPLNEIIAALNEHGEPKELLEVLRKFEQMDVHIHRRGAPEHYYKNEDLAKSGWDAINGPDDLKFADELKALLHAAYTF